MRDFLISLHAVVLLRHLGGRANSTVLANNICVNPVQVRRALAPLVHAGILQITGGRGGGYQLAPGQENIPLADVANLCQADFLSGLWKTGNEQENCCISSGMTSYLHTLHSRLNTAVLEELATITVAQVEELLSHSEHHLPEK